MAGSRTCPSRRTVDHRISSISSTPSEAQSQRWKRQMMRRSRVVLWADEDMARSIVVRPDSAVRSHIMRSVRRKDTGPEVALRQALFRAGYRYRKNVQSLPGSPDIVMAGKKIAIFIDGCFWHRHGCKRTTMPRTNVNFWKTKFDRNVERDQANFRRLKELGWRVLRIWECGTIGLDGKALHSTAQEAIRWIEGVSYFGEIS